MCLPGRAQLSEGFAALRARPQPVTRINRRALIGDAAVALILISGLVLALKPPTLRGSKPEELIDVEHKPMTDGLAKLPATYDSTTIVHKDIVLRPYPTNPSN